MTLLLLLGLSAGLLNPLESDSHSEPGSKKEPVKISLELKPEELSGPGEVLAVVRLEIAAGWYLYGPSDRSQTENQALRAELRLPPGCSGTKWEYSSADQTRPPSHMMGEWTLTQRIRVSGPPGEFPISVTISYQACNSTFCAAPESRVREAVLRVQKDKTS